MTAKRAVGALGVVVVHTRQSVVEQQHEPGFERIAQARDPGLDARAELGAIAVFQFERQAVAHNAPRRRDFGARRRLALDKPDETGSGRDVARATHPIASGAARHLNAHAELAHVIAPNDDALTRQRIQHFVGENHAADGLRGKRIEPHHAVTQFGRELLDARTLAFAQICADFEDRVLLRQTPERCKRAQYRCGHPPCSGTQLEHGSADSLEHLQNLARDALTEQIGHFGRRREIASAADLYATRAVIAESGRVERELHELIERQPAARRLGALANESRHRAGVRLFFGRHRRQH